VFATGERDLATLLMSGLVLGVKAGRVLRGHIRRIGEKYLRQENTQ